ncbi:MAG: outer membrane lipoprotein-sorting protein [Deltaproteobacteria bacterium]|nr:outer membrane lipoprotein-sorting protein [Deltaproteobacteria bacterium]
MRKAILCMILLTIFLLQGGPGTLAQTPDGNDLTEVDTIIEQANLAAYYAGRDGRATVRMMITDAQQRVREREFTILRFDQENGGRQKFYVYFKQPSDVKGMVFMVHKFVDRDDDRWLYLPALDLVRRIAAADKRTSFVGSDFFYEDVSGRSLSEDEHRLLETTAKHYVIESRPRDPATVEFSSYRVWIDKQTMLPLKAEYQDRENRLYRRVEALKTETIEGHPTVVESRVENLAAGSVTISRFSNISYDIDLKEDLFSERYLRRPPRDARK